MSDTPTPPEPTPERDWQDIASELLASIPNLYDVLNPRITPEAQERLVRAIAQHTALAALQVRVEAGERWRDGVPDVPEGKEDRFLVSSGGIVRVLLYCNKHWAPCSDAIDPSDDQPYNEDTEEYQWNGWCEESCEQCDTFWTFGGKVNGWMPLPARR